MGKISDIWVRLGLKKEGFDKGMDDAAKKSNKTGGEMKKMFSQVKGGWVAVAAAVVAVSRVMSQAPNRISDAWNRTIEGVKNGWNAIIAEVSNYKPDFSSFKNFFKNEANWFRKTFSNTKDAAKAGSDMAAAFDAEFELTRSIAIQREKIKGQLADLRVTMANANLSLAERRAAANKYKALLEPLYKAEIETRKDMLDAAVKAWLAGTGADATTAQVVDFFTYIGTDAAAMAKKYPELARVYNDFKGDKTNEVIFTAIQNLTAAQNGLANELKEVNATANSLIKESPYKGLKKEINEFTKEFNNSLMAADKALTDEIQAFTDIRPEISFTIGIEDSDLEGVNELLDYITSKFQKEAEKIAEYNKMIEDSIITSMSNGLQAITDMMFGLEGADMKNALAAFIAPLGDTMKQMGAMIMSEGIAMTAFKKSFTNPAAAIAAGVALIAVGSAVSSGLQRLTANPGGGTGYSSGSSASAGVQNYESEMTIYVEGKISGSDIVLAGNKTLKNWRR